MRKRFRDARFSGFLAKLHVLLNTEMTEWMPIWTWLIEHPAGNFLVDTGEISVICQPNYFDGLSWFDAWVNKTLFEFEVRRKDEIDVLLEKAGFSTDAIDKVLMTHLHMDHADGLCHFPKSEILVNRAEWEKPFGALPKTKDGSWNPTFVDLNENFGPFKAKRLAEGLWLVDTPGHTFGHCSVVLETEEGLVFLAGDASYNQDQLENNVFSAGVADLSAAKKSYEDIKKLAKEKPLVYLPSHDAEVINRLRAKEYLGQSIELVRNGMDVKTGS